MALPFGSSGNVAASSQKPGAACDTLQRLLTELCKRNSTSKEGSLLTFRKHVEEEARDLNGEALTRFLDSLYERISALIDSTELNDNLGALHAINALVDVKLGESAAKTARFSNYIRRVFEEKHEPEVLVAASDVLGRLAEAGGPQTADVVETQVKRALEWLQGERIESRRFAAVLILKEMADHAPTVFNMHVPEFIDAVWVALRDQKLAIRERAVEALRSCLKVIVKRETRWRVQWYFRMFEATQGGLAKNASVESIHGSLLAVGELLRNTGEFMMSRYKEVSDIVLKFRDHRDRLVRRSVTALLPRIAHFLRDRFVASYLKMYMQHLLFVMRNPLERAYGFVALGEMAGAVGCELAPFLPEITILLRDAIAPRKGRASMEAIACIGSLTEALGSAMEEHARNMLDAMFASGLSEILVTSLNQIASSLPSLLPMIQERLLDSISLVLCKAPYWTTKKRGPLVRPQPIMPMVPLSDVNKAAVVQLALRTLTTFDLKGHELLEFTREAVVPYLEDDDAVIRRDAAGCCCRLVDHSSQVAANFTSSRLAATRGSRNAGFRKHRFIIEEILEKLLVAAVADADSGVRKAVFTSLHSNGTFYEFLAQADSLRAIFIALNDEAFEVRELSIRMTGKLSDKNPAYVLPALRRHLQQLLTDLEHSADSKNREESAILLGSLIRACEHLILPYIVPIEEVLVARLREGTGGSGNNAVIAGVLSTVGELARVAGCAIRPYFEVVMPLIVEALLDGAADSKREVAVATIGQLVHSTGYAVTPYIKHPQLLDVLLHLLNGELAWSTKVLKVLGIIGALDPHIHKQNQQSLQAGHADRQSASEGGARAHSVEDFPTEMWPSGGLFATSDDHYSTVAINALMRVLREPSLSSYHLNVVKSLMYICRVMGLGCVPYLPKVMPDLFRTIHSCEEGLREFIFCQLADLVTIVRQHIRKYLPEILLLISEFWSLMIVPASSRPAKHSPILHLVEKLCVALNDEFRSYMPEILPRCIQVLCDAERFGDYSYVPLMLHTLEVFGGTLDEHMHLVLPVLVRLFRPDVSDAPLEIRRSTIKTFARLLPSMQVSAHVSALLHPLTRVLDGTIDELRKDAIDAICALATALGSEFVMFIPSVRKLLQRHHLQSTQFDGIEERLRKREPIPSDLQSNMAIVSSNAAGDVHGLAGSLQHSFELEGEQIDVDGIDPSTQMRNFKVNEGQLRSAWETSQRSTKEDWVEWMRHFSLELLRQSPSPALRTCAYLAQRQPHIAKELFAVAFVSCWSQLSDGYRQQLVRSLNYALTATNIPPEILATLLNLAEFMERDEKPLPVDTRTLGGLAEKCHLFAKALHYKEMEFDMELEKRRKDMESGHMTSDPRLVAAVEALIHVNNQLHQNEAADGILRYARDHLGVELKESWLEKLQRWDDACRAYTTKASQATSHDLLEANLGRMRCLAALARWEELSAICNESWVPADPTARLEMAPMAACAAWNMGEWEDMAVYVSCLDSGDEMSMTMASSDAGSSGVTGSFYRAVLAVRSGKYDVARECVERARKCLATELAALVLESYDRAYGNMVQVQQLAELEEVIDYHMLQQSGNESSAALIRQMWCDRIRGAKRNVEVWQSLLSVRTLVLPPSEDMATWMKFSSLCRKSGREGQARATLVKLLKFDPEKEHPSSGIGYMGAPPVMLAYLKYLWSRGEQLKAFQHLQELASQLVANGSIPCIVGPTNSASCVAPGSLLARVYLKLGDWNWSLHPVLDEESIRDISSAYRGATECARLWVKAWHKFALFNTAVMSHYTYRGNSGSAGKYVVLAVQGFFRSIAHASSKNDASSSKGTPLCKSISSRKGEDDCLQDILRLLTLWFNHGASLDVQNALEEGFKHVNIDTWLVVLPQIIARIHSNTPAVKKLIQSLLVRIGQSHPQALMYPLLVACKSISSLRRAAAQDVVDKVRQHHGLLVEQAQLVSKELIRVAILWHEIWHEALEEASRLYFGEHNVEGMLNVLEPLHSMLENEGAVTVKEIAFEQAYGRELQEAHECCNKYRRTGKEAELTQAWDLYYHVFKRINKQLPSVTTLELEYVSPALLNAKNLELAVPGTYRAGVPVVTIAHFVPQLVVITSKQRPRRCTIHGSDGEDYAFLLKGHEDLRQDERVMQLFGLVNTLLANSRQTAEKDLSIQRYSVIPLAPNSGLIGWVPNHDTLHQLIREYRDARKIPVNVEHRQMLSFAPDYEHLTLIAKVEVFQHALENTAGDDLAKVFWLKSKTSEVWLDRRTNYTRSLAVMSMVGYLLGLGDRHPSNLMLDRHSGKILHIDFGDCFEASMNREKFPEKVPFRLTRMLVKAMEVSGIEGNFRSTCENVMQVLRSNKDSVMAMMEAFVHDPLINWRLFNLNDVPHTAGLVNIRNQPATEGNGSTMLPSPPQRGARERELREAVGQLGDANEVLNERAVAVMARMRNKLTGRDFSTFSQNGVIADRCVIGDAQEVEPGLSVEVQVEKLIAQATSHENLCQSYVGWCPFW